jgi:hypothetical protein
LAPAGALPPFLPYVAEVVLHCASGRVIGSLAIASRTRGAQRPGDRKLLLRLAGESQLVCPHPTQLHCSSLLT